MYAMETANGCVRGIYTERQHRVDLLEGHTSSRLINLSSLKDMELHICETKQMVKGRL